MNDSSPKSRRDARRAKAIQDRRVSQRTRVARQRRQRRLLQFSLIGVTALILVGLIYTVITIVNDKNPGPPAGVETTRNVTTGHSTEELAFTGDLPPVGGIHSPLAPQACTFYDSVVPPERALHSLEHGAIWITYQPELPRDQIALLRSIADQSKVLVSPFPEQPSAVVATAWGEQLQLAIADDPDLQQFVEAFKGGGRAPEARAQC